MTRVVPHLLNGPSALALRLRSVVRLAALLLFVVAGIAVTVHRAEHDAGLSAHSDCQICHQASATPLPEAEVVHEPRLFQTDESSPVLETAVIPPIYKAYAQRAPPSFPS